MNKFNIGDQVHCYRKSSKGISPFDFVGIVEDFNDVGEEDYEYLVSNAPKKESGEFPLLIWESEMILIRKG